MVLSEFRIEVERRLNFHGKTPYDDGADGILGPINRALSLFTERALTNSGRMTVPVINVGDIDLREARVALPLAVVVGGATLRDPSGRSRPLSPSQIAILVPNGSDAPKYWGMLGPQLIRLWPGGASEAVIEGYVLHPTVEGGADPIRIPSGVEELCADLAASFAINPEGSGSDREQAMMWRERAMSEALELRVHALASNPSAAYVAGLTGGAKS